MPDSNDSNESNAKLEKSCATCKHEEECDVRGAKCYRNYDEWEEKK